MTNLEQAKINFADACIQLEIAQSRYNEYKNKLVQEMNKKPEVV
jgi:hypothetical protein